MIVGASLMVIVNVWAAAGLMPLSATTGNLNRLPVPAAGVPEMVAVPLPLSLKVRPAGRTMVPIERVVAAG